MAGSLSFMQTVFSNATSTTVAPFHDTSAFPTAKDNEERGLVLLVVACICCGLWLIYMTLYHSRLIGSLITKLITMRYLKEGEFFEMGALSFSILSGKIMFRDVKYITKDLSIRIVDGYAIFKYWLPYIAEEPYRQPFTLNSTETSTEIESKDHRLTIWLNCFEYHVYNRAGLYDQLQDLFRVERYGDAAKSSLNIHNVDAVKKSTSEWEKSEQESNKGLPTWLLELIPAIKFDINTGKIAFGNKLFETTLCFMFENAVGFYRTSEAHSSLDQFMHLVKMTGKNVRIMLCPSPGYTGSKDEPPRFMGNGFVVLNTAQCRINYYQDEPGLVPEGNVGNVEAGIPDSDPHWGVDVVFLKSTSMCYGPWVDRQRDALQKFFFPMDYQEMVATKPLPPGQTRLHTGLDVKFHFEVDATLDILFSKDQETKAVHVCFGAGSHLGVYQPWTVNEYGYTTSVITKLYQVEASTSMAYRKLVDADVLDLAVHMTFPRVWNQTQHWSCEISAFHVTWWFIFAHKWFFQEMLEDWTANYRPDLVTFVPYEWSFNIALRDFEMVWIANEYNYMECTSNKQEMAELAFCGELFDLTFVLQFLRFLPEFEEIKFFLQVEKLVARLCLPEHDTLHRSLLCLAQTASKSQTQPSVIRSRSSTSTGYPEEGIESADESAFTGSNNDTFNTIFSRHTAKNHGWVDVMSVPILGLSIGYMYHPIIPNPKYIVPRNEPLKWQPSEMEPDVITLELEAGPAALRLFGSVLKVLAAIKENYFGEDQVFQECPPFNSNMPTFTAKDVNDVVKDTINLFTLRPLEANVFISLYDFKAELTKHCGAAESSSPLLLFERLTFEMKKSLHETRLQLHLTPMTILVSDGYERGACASHLSQGHLSLSGFQMRGHAMFSGEGLPPDSETLEYAWLTELQFGILSGKITIPQLQAIVNWAQTFIFHVMSKENKLQPPIPYKTCIHGHRQDKCEVNNPKINETQQKSPQLSMKNERNSKRKSSETNKSFLEKPEEVTTKQKDICITEDEVKYRMTRVSLEDINLFVVETGIACNVQLSPIRLATCTLHCDNSTTGISMFIQNIKLRQFVLAPKPLVADPVFDDIHKRMSLSDDIVWMEAAGVQFGPIISDISLDEEIKDHVIDQKSFLALHDKKHQRLWFLWSSSNIYKSPVKNHGCCGCSGGCNFFSNNINGPRFFTSEKLDASNNDTGITGFGSETGLYDEGDLHDEDTKPLMYSRDALGSAYLDQTPVGSVEAFTRKRYHGSEASSSPRLKRGYLMRSRHGNTDENNPNDPVSQLSWHDSLQRSPSTASSKMRFMPNESIRSSKPSLVKKPRIRPLASCSSQGSFYSCGSLVDDDLDTNVELSLRGAYSSESFASAVENPHDLPDFVNGTSPQISDFVVSCPQLVSRYSQQLSQLECLNWNIPADIPPSKRVFNIVENLKETEPSDPLVLPGVPQFNYRNPPRFKQPLLIKKSQVRKGQQTRDKENEADVSSTSTESVHVVADGNILRKSYREDDSLEESSEAGSTRKAAWNTSFNEHSLISSSSPRQSFPIRTSTTTSSNRENVVILRFDGEINMFFSPLLMDALQRYAASITKQDSLLHPSLVVDLVHDMCTTTADSTYKKRLDRTRLERELPCKPNQITALINTSKIHMAFLQVAFPEAETKSDVFTGENDKNAIKEPSTSIFVGSFEGISTRLLSIQKAADDISTNSKTNLEDIEIESAQKDKPSEGSVVHKTSHRNTSSVLNIKCNETQLQLHELCNKEDFEKSVTTAIADNLSRTKFILNVDHLHSLTDSYNVDEIPANSYMNLLMLECGLENITVCGGSECGSGSEVLPKLCQKHHTIKTKSKFHEMKSFSSEEPKFHGFSNPIQEDTGSVVLNMDLAQREDDNSHTIDLSSLSSSISSLSSSCGGDESDMESEAGEQQLLLSSKAEKETQKRLRHAIHHDSVSFIDKDVELARRIDVKFHLSSIWFNIASPPSSKALPSTYHLYNSLVTTIIPMSIAWIPGILELKETISTVRRSRHDRLTSVIACLMSQALPDHGKIPKKHGIHVLVNDAARYLQEDHSSQLLYILRKQLMGSRLEKVRSALVQKHSIPDNKKLIKGIFALARQWKCFLAGTEKGEILFYGTNSIKRHVVGRGVLTERDRAILMKEDDHHAPYSPPQETTSHSGQEQGGTTGDPSSINSDEHQQEDETSKLLNSNAQSSAVEDIRLSQRITLVETSPPAHDTDTETDESPPTTMSKDPQNKHLLGADGKKYGHRKQLSLYSWLSNTPATSPNTAARGSGIDGLRPTKLTIQSPLVSPVKSEQNNAIFSSEMVSVPTSGKKIQDEKETFKTLLQAINLKPKIAEDKDTAKTISLTTTLKCIRLDLVDGEINNISTRNKQQKITKKLFKDEEPIFLAKDFNLRLLFRKCPLDTNIFSCDLQTLSHTKVNRVKFSVGFGDVTQKVNFPFVRLVVQLVDMVDVLAGLVKSKAEEIEADQADGPTPHFTSIFGQTKVRSLSPSSVKCWKTMYQVLDLYSSLPREHKVKPGFKKAGTLGAVDSPMHLKDVTIEMEEGPPTFNPSRRQDDHRPLIDTYSIVGVVTLPRARLLASIGDLRQEIDIKDVSLVLTKTEEKGVDETDGHSGSISCHIGNVYGVLLERLTQNHGMVVSIHMSRSHVVYSYESRAKEDKNVALVTVGIIDVEIPQHPVALHTMMTRSSRTISRHITDMQGQRSLIRSMGVADTSPPPSYTKRLSGVPAEFVKQHLVGSPTSSKTFADSVDGTKPDIIPVKCDIVLKGFCLSASLLPSLRAGYKIGTISATTRTGTCSKFKATMLSHSLMFSSKVQTFESNVPSSAMVDLPPVKVSGEFLAAKPTRPRSSHRAQRAHLFMNAEIGAFQHCLTTDLLNHLVFVQKSFLKEVNDVVQRVSGESQPVPLWRTISSESFDSSKDKEAPFSYLFGLTLKGIQITATTPAATAVRLDTGVISLEVSNAIPSPIEHGKLKRSGSFVKLFGKAQVDINLSLGQFIKSRIIDNELDYMQMAYFKTTIGVRNSFQDVSSTRGTEDKETFLITLTQPKVYAQQMAFDKAVLVYLNYKNAYDHWNQQKMSLHAEVHTATQALLEKLPARSHAAQLSGSVFLQVTVDRLGICIPLFSTNQPNVPAIYSKQNDEDRGSALILSVDEMMLSCCSSTSFVSRGKFNRFCLWFTDRFDMEASDWRPDSNLRLMNTCVVSEGTYELCSKTNRYPIVPDMVKTGKWVMSIRWQMCGVEVLTDTNIGKWLSLLGNTLTAFAGETDIANLDSVADMTEKEPTKEPVECRDEVDHKPTSSRKPRKQSLEREMWEQARKVNELRRHSDVNQSTLEKETKHLQELENAVFNEFRKGVRKKIRKHSRSRQTYPYHISTQKTTAPQRKAMSERPKSSNTRSRLRRQVVEYDSDYDDDPLLKRKPRSNLNVSDIPLLAAPDFAGMESTSTLTCSREDVLDEGERGTLFCSTPDSKQQSWTHPSHPKVKFSSSATELNEFASLNPRSSMLTQQNLDFELDVIVNIDSGKCVLHLASESEDTHDMRTPSNRTFISEPPKSKPFSPNFTSGARRYKTNSQDINSQDTVILLPGVDVRVNYSSNFESEPGSPSPYGQDGSVLLLKPPDQSSNDTQPQAASSNMKVFKTAGVYISVLFQSLPQEMVLKPSLIDFLERALEPIIVPNREEIDAGGSVSDNGSDPELETGGSVVSSSMSESSSFPVDVVVVFRVKPSDIRLSCQPVSKVECMLRLPALDVVFSSKSSSNKTPVLMQSSDQLKLDEKSVQAFDSGGISFTFCLSSFSFCIFHPYGKEHTAVTRSTSSPIDNGDSREENRPRFRFNPPQPMSGKKDSLSLDVEFIKFNLSRRRVCDGQDVPCSPGPTSSTVVSVSGICDIGSAAFTYDMRRLNEILDFPKAWYKRRLVSRLFLGKEGSYAAKTVSPQVPFQSPQVVRSPSIEEKRRSSPVTTEVQTPLSHQGRPVLNRSMSEDERHLQALPTPLKIPTKQRQTHKKTTSTAGLFSFLPSSPSLFRSMTMTGNRQGLLSPTTTPKRMKRRTLSEQEDIKKRTKLQQDSVVHSTTDNTDTEVDGPLSQSSSSSGSKSKWETVIVVAVNLSKLEVNTNMGSVMGQTLWSTSDLRAQGHLTLTSSGRRHLQTKLKVRQAVCESRSGIVGGHVEINDFIAKANGTEERGCKPEHMVQIKLCHAETRIDYMGTCILMGNISTLQADLKDQWILQQGDSPSTDSLFKVEKESPVQKEPPQCKIYVKADMSWRDFKLMLSRSTTPDLIKMIAKIQEFFSQQHRNSLRALSTLRNPTPLNTGTILSNLATPQHNTPTKVKDKDIENDGLKYQHWSKVLNAVTGLKLSMLSDPIPDRGVILGGSLALRGKTVSLACFHGVNFRAQSWVLFNLKQLCTEFISRVRAEEKSCDVRRVRAVQTLMIKLGYGEEDENLPGNLSPSMTYCFVVRKVSRGRRNPPSMGSTVQEWLTYVCATGEDDIYPSDDPPKRGDSFNNSGNKKQSQGNRARANSYRYEHDSEPVFGLPKFEVELETKHDMPMSYLASTWSRRRHSTTLRALTRPSPHVVQCSLTSSFEDSLCVTMDVGLLFFLHDVVKSYIKENETSSGSIPRGAPSPSRSDKSETDERDVPPKVDQQKRIRQFRSEGWKLEPRVRFMSWAGKNIEPVNIDWVLQKLGFTHARLTIPKWAQRGAMDPMDVFISMLIDKMMATMQEDSSS